MTYLIFFDETNEGGALDFNRLPGSVVQGDDEMEEIRFAQVARRLLLEVRPANAQPGEIHNQSVISPFNLDKAGGI